MLYILVVTFALSKCTILLTIRRYALIAFNFLLNQSRFFVKNYIEPRFFLLKITVNLEHMRNELQFASYGCPLFKAD